MFFSILIDFHVSNLKRFIRTYPCVDAVDIGLIIHELITENTVHRISIFPFFGDHTIWIPEPNQFFDNLVSGA